MKFFNYSHQNNTLPNQLNTFGNIYESKTSVDILQSEISSYIRKVKKDLPAEVTKIIQLSSDLGIVRKSQLDKIMSATKTEVGTTLYKDLKLDISGDEGGNKLVQLYDIWALLRSFKDRPTKLKMLPQYQSEAEREAIEKGKLSMSDLTIDLKTPAGRNAAAKIYMPVVIKIVNKYIGVSKLDKSELMSAGMEGMTLAMDDWKPELGQSFKSYMAYRVKYAIVDEMTKNGHTFSGIHQNSKNLSDKAKEKGKAGYTLDAVSLDALTSGIDDDFKQDYLSALASVDAEDYEAEKDKILKKGSSELVRMIDSVLSERDADILYTYFGMNGRKKMSGADIGRKYGVSSSYIHNGIIKKLYGKITKLKDSNEILMSLRDAYMENLLYPIWRWENKQAIQEHINKDVFVDFIYEATRFSDPEKFQILHNEAVKYMKDADIMEEIINGDFKKADFYVKKYRDSIILYLNNLYTNEADFSRSTDVELIEQLVNLQNVKK